MFRALVISGWICFAIEALIICAAIVVRDMGTDAAGRGLAFGLGLVALGPLLLGGVGLYFAGRRHSTLGVIASVILLTSPLLVLLSGQVEGMLHDARVTWSNRIFDRYPEPAQRDLANAIARSDFDKMRKILATHPNLKGVNGGGLDLLAYAVTYTFEGDSQDCQRAVEAVRLLLDAGMDPNQSRDHSGDLNLRRLSYHLDQPPAQQAFLLLLEKGAKADDEKTSLLFSAWECPNCFRALLDHGAAMEVRNPEGDTPLQFLVYNARVEAALMLLQRGANRQGVDTAFQQAKARMDPEVAARIETALAAKSEKEN